MGENAIDMMFTMGVLHDVGRMAYTEMFGEKYTHVMKSAESLAIPMEQVESRLLLFNHADAMDRLLHAWGFPKEMINPIAFHHLSVGNIRRMSPRGVNEAAILGLANRIAHALLLGSSGNKAIYPTQEFVAALRIGGDLMNDIEQRVTDETNDIKFTILSRLNQESWPQLRNEVCAQIGAPVRPLFIGADPAIDAVRMFCDRLRDTGSDPNAPPNLAMVHISHPREKISLSTKLKEAEAQAQLKPLPLLLVSSSGNTTLDAGAMANRTIRTLALPAALSRFVGTIKELLTAAPQAQPLAKAA